MAGALLLALAILGWSREASAQLIDSELEGSSSSFQVHKRDLEFNQYVPAYRLRGEPSCEELRAMWRLSKREARRATSTNQLPRSRVFRYGRLRTFAPVNAYGSRTPSFGTLNYESGHRQHYRLPQKGAFSRLRTMMGGTSRPGAFGELRDTLAKERGSSETPRGSYDKVRGMILKEIAETEEQPVVRTLRDGDQFGVTRRRDPSVPVRSAQYQMRGFVDRLLPGDPQDDSAQIAAVQRATQPDYDAVSYIPVNYNQFLLFPRILGLRIVFMLFKSFALILIIHI